ncbi:MAG: nicotinate (nicotinamide) nucleotide adenylyltransferase [Prevotella sp.]|jgi:nicotinate-nucleotide adenylyltransferase
MIETGFFGGSFNPIHTGHISLAERILREAKLDEIWFVVSPLNPFKRDSDNLLDDDKRLELVRRALEGHDRLVASGYEFHLPRPSYTWKTLKGLQTDYPDRRFSLIIGADNWLAFDRWRNSDYIRANYPIWVYPRPGCPLDPASLPQGVSYLDLPLYDLSSTEIRQKVENGESIQGLVPDNIRGLVEKYYALKPEESNQSENSESSDQSDFSDQSD